jgi:hypothetical protein
MTTAMTTAQDRSLASINPMNRQPLPALAGAAGGVYGVHAYAAAGNQLPSLGAYMGMVGAGALWMYLRPTCPIATFGGTALMSAGAYGGIKVSNL